MKRTREELRLLAGKEFNAILAADPELARLRRLPFNRALESRVLLETLGLGDFRIGDLPVRPLTIARLSLLWMLDSPFVCEGRDADETELDIALFILSRRDLREIGCALDEFPAAASGLRAATGLEPEEAATEIEEIFRSALSPFGMIPTDNDESKEARYDGEWATALGCIAAQESGRPLDFCLHEMSLSCAGFCLVNFLRRGSPDARGIRRRPTAEVAAEIDERIEELSKEYLEKHLKK